MMSSRQVAMVLSCGFGVILALLLPSFNARLIAAIIVAIFVLVHIIRASEIARLASASEESRQAGAGPSDIFAFGQLFEATMGGMREGLLVVDKDMRVIASNAAAHRLFDPARGPLDRQRLTELTRNPAIYAAFLDALQGTERSGVKIQTHGPERLVFDLRVVPLGRAAADDAQTATGALGVFIDVTRIERLEQVRQEFLSNVSHELRTPLTAILAFVETLESSAIEDPEASRRFLSIIRKNALRMQELINDILELTAIEEGNVQVRPERVDVYPIVSDVISSLTAKAAVERLSVVNAVPRGATVYADARRLEQMLTNLIDNAVKFNRDSGSVTIRYQSGPSVSEQDGGVGFDSIIIEDTGEGIPSQHLPRLFERFYRVDRARSREMGGTGLGLAIVKHLARAHGGEVTVTSELGRGSTFAIELPRRNASKA